MAPYGPVGAPVGWYQLRHRPWFEVETNQNQLKRTDYCEPVIHQWFINLIKHYQIPENVLFINLYYQILSSTRNKIFSKRIGGHQPSSLVELNWLAGWLVGTGCLAVLGTAWYCFAVAGTDWCWYNGSDDRFWQTSPKKIWTKASNGTKHRRAVWAIAAMCWKEGLHSTQHKTTLPSILALQKSVEKRSTSFHNADLVHLVLLPWCSLSVPTWVVTVPSSPSTIFCFMADGGAWPDQSKCRRDGRIHWFMLATVYGHRWMIYMYQWYII